MAEMTEPDEWRGPGRGAMVRSEEELHVKTVSRPRTRVRLRKYIVTEMVTKTVPVRREEIRLEREPITAAESVSVASEQSSDEVYEIVLHEEQVVTETRVVPTERVRLRKETVIEERAATDDIRKEQVVMSEIIPTGNEAEQR